MFKYGFLFGSNPSRSRILSKIDPSHHVQFEFGYESANSEIEHLEYSEFQSGYSSLLEIESKPFKLLDKSPTSIVSSSRIGRSVAFRNHVLKAYENQCCLCSDSLVNLAGAFETEAAHIVPKRNSGSDDVRNGLALCRKHHWAFDQGLFGLNDDYTVLVSPRISGISENASLGRFLGQSIHVPSSGSPHPSALTWHRNNILCS